jgi:RNA polymerase sigma-54 factor
MKLLQVPTANLEERIKEEMEENPALEQGENDDDNFDEHKDDDSGSDDDYEMDGNEDDYGNVDISDYVADGDDEVGDYKLRDDNYPEIDDNKVIPYRVETTFHDMLADQLGMLKLNERDLRMQNKL